MKIVCILLVAALLGSCASQPRKVGIDDPFSDQLAHYHYLQRNYRRLFVAATLVFLAAISCGTVFATINSLSDNDDYVPYLATSYSLSIASFGFGGFSLIQWSRNADAYLETLRLQQQYYNIIDPRQ